MIDTVFKIGLLLIGIVFLIVFHQFAQNNRYRMDNNLNVYDTRTGKLYLLGNGEWIMTDPIRGNVNKVPIKRPN